MRGKISSTSIKGQRYHFRRSGVSSKTITYLRADVTCFSVPSESEFGLFDNLQDGEDGEILHFQHFNEGDHIFINSNPKSQTKRTSSQLLKITCLRWIVIFPQLFRSGKTSSGATFCTPCARYSERSSRAKGIDVILGLPDNFPLKKLNCKSIHPALFYQTFNSRSRSLYLARKVHNLPLPYPPLIFNLDGRFIDVGKWWPRGQFYFKAEHNLPEYIAAQEKKLYGAEMPSSCKDIRAALAQCLQESDCVMVYRNKPSDCLRPPLIDSMPTKCQQLKKGYGECKRGMVDMRKRFRGNQPIAVSKEIEGGAQNPSHQLYAGKPAFRSAAKETDGNEPEEKDWRELENEKFRKGV